MTLYAALLYYPADQYWMSPEETRFARDYGTFGAAQIPAAWRGKVELRPVVPMAKPGMPGQG